MKKKYLLIVFLLGIMVAGALGYFIYNKPHKDYLRMPAEFSLTADELYEEFEQNTARAEKEYAGKILEVSGKIEELSVAKDGTGNIILAAESAMMGGVHGRLNSRYREEGDPGNQFEGLMKGDPVTIKCRCLGFEADIISEVKLDQCFIIKE